MSMAGLLPVWSKIYIFKHFIVADLRIGLLDVIARVWFRSSYVYAEERFTHAKNSNIFQTNMGKFSLSYSLYYAVFGHN